MDINSKDYIRSFENIIPSEDFLAKTKNAMLNEAEKQKKRKRIMLRVAPIATAACLTLVFTFAMINQPKSMGSANNNAQPESIALDEADIEQSDEAFPEEIEEAPDEEMFIEDESLDALPNTEITGSDDNTEGGSGNSNFKHYDDMTDEDVVDDDDESFDYDTDINETPLNFAVPIGGKAIDFSNFSPDDTEKLAEFLEVVSEDMINAEVIYSSGETADIFGEDAQKLNLEITENINTSKITEKKDFEPTVSYTFFDDKTGSVLYSIRTDGIFTALSIKNGEEVYFQKTAD